MFQGSFSAYAMKAAEPSARLNIQVYVASLVEDDLRALEQALRLKEAHPDIILTFLAMGSSQAEEMVRDAIFRGADRGFLLTDPALVGADALTISDALAKAILHIEPDADLLLVGSGDTVQIGSLVAENIGLPHIADVEEILSCQEGKMDVKRCMEGGIRIEGIPLPCLLTVKGNAAPCRPKNVRRIMRYKHQEIPHLSCSDIGVDLRPCGPEASPTIGKATGNTAPCAKKCKVLTGSDEDIRGLIPLLASVQEHEVGVFRNSLQEASVVVAGGYGMGSKEGFDLLRPLAQLLHGEVGATRAAVDAGFCEPDLQIGQTGVRVHPKVYIACGISGAIQHVSGMKDSALVISINNDPQAPICQIADYAVCGNVEEVIPKMIKYYLELGASLVEEFIIHDS